MTPLNTFKSVFPALLLLISSFSFGQVDSLMDLLEDDTNTKKPKEEVKYIFKSTRIINSSSVENLAKGVMDMRISHRFGRVNEGAENFFGIDNANTRIGLDYGITQFLMIGIGHNVLNKENDGFLKVKLLKQRKEGLPFTLSYLGAIAVQTEKAPILPADKTYKYANRLSYVHQLLIARKFSDAFSLQLMPTLLHLNFVDSNKYDNDILALGVAGRVRLSRRVSLTGEYFYRFTGADNKLGSQKTYNSLSFGFDIETGGHVFQLHFTNSPGISERVVVGSTTDTWANGDMHYGFNISRVFTIVKPKEFKNKRRMDREY
jgi:hypothetical protein